VKFPYPTLARLMSGRSAIVEPGDGEMTVPPVMQPVLDIFSPVRNLLSIPSPSNDSWIFSSTLLAVGAAGVQTQNFPTFAAGRWDIDISLIIRFVGTTTVNSSAAIILNDGQGNVMNVMDFKFFGGGSPMLARTFPMLFINSGWFFSHSTDATVAGDFLASQASIYARRIF